MKYGHATIFAFASALAATLVTGCKPQKSSGSGPTGAVVVFEGSGVALSPGENWKPVRSGELAASIWGERCLPILEGEGGLIEVYSARADRSNAKARAAKLRTLIEQQPDTLKTSLKQENFETESGIHGVHLSYNKKEEANARKWLSRTHFYVIRNNQGFCVTVCYIVMANRDAEAVHEMIRRTLVLQ